MHKMFYLFAHVFALSGLLLAAGCSRQEVITQQAVVVGSETGTVRVATSFAEDLSKSASSIQKTLTDVISTLDPANEDSELSKLNRVGDSIRLPVSRTVFRAIDLARHYNELTGGAFDITTGAMTLMWKSGIPDEAMRLEALSRSGQRFLEVSETGGVALTTPGVVIEPGRFAHAYAIDSAMVERRKNADGPCLLIWSDMARRDGFFPPDESPVVSLVANRVIGNVSLARHSSFVVVRNKTGINYDPILEPSTGHPATGASLVAVIGPLTVKSYALARALVILGREHGAEILGAFPGYEALLLPGDESTTVWMTPGFDGAFTADPSFTARPETWLPDEIDTP